VCDLANRRPNSGGLVTTFEYLAVLFSVVVGLAVAQTLQGLLRVMLHRESVTVSWPALVWTACVLQWAIFFWWSSGLNLVQVREWRFTALLWVLAYGSVLYFLLGLLYPDDIGEGFDMRGHFERNRVWFFGLFLGLGLIDAADTWYKLANGLWYGEHLVEYIAFLAVWLIGAGMSIRVRDPRFQVVTGLLFVAMTCYVAQQGAVIGVMLADF